MLMDPKARVMLQEQVSKVQEKMIDRAMEVFKEYENYVEDEKRVAFDTLIKIYNDYTTALIHDILLPLDAPGDNSPLRAADFTQLIRRLYRGYANFVYDTTRSRLNQRIEEDKQKEILNNDSADVTTGEEEPSFPEENVEDGN